MSWTPKYFVLYTKEDIEEMKRLRFIENKTVQFIADKFDVSRETIRQLLGNTGRISERYKKSKITKIKE